MRRGDTVTLLNRDDPDWFWVRDQTGAQGFVPASYISPFTDSKQLSGSDDGIQFVLTRVLNLTFY